MVSSANDTQVRAQNNGKSENKSFCELSITSLCHTYVPPGTLRHLLYVEVVIMALGQTQYFYTVELSALEENLGLSMDRVARLREKAMRRNDTQAADQINKLQRVIGVVQQRVARLK